MSGNFESSDNARLLASDSLNRFRRLRLRAFGSSMLPNILPGDVLDFESSAVARIEPGDVVLYRREDGGLAVHRIVACSDQGLLAQGDGLHYTDPRVDHVRLLGRMIGHHRKGRALRMRRPRHLWLSRWLFGRSSLAARIFLRWHRGVNRASA